MVLSFSLLIITLLFNPGTLELLDLQGLAVWRV